MGNVDYTEAGYSFIFRVFYEYFGGNWWILLLLAAAVIFIFINNFDNDRQKLGYTVITLLLTVYNPLFIKLLMKVLHFENEYYRFIWLLPVAVLIGCAFIRLIEKMQSKWVQGGIVVVAVILFAMTAPISYAQDNFSWQENIYKVPNELIETINIIKSDSSGKDPTVVFEQEYNFIARQYDASIHLALERNRMLYALGSTTVGTYSDEDYNNQRAIIGATMLGEAVDVAALDAALDYTKTNYLVLNKSRDLTAYMMAAGCQLIGETENNIIYKYR